MVVTDAQVDLAPAWRTGERWTRLFNGKDTTGWKTHPGMRAYWKVENKPRRPRHGEHVFSERGDYQNFHYRIEAKLKRRWPADNCSLRVRPAPEEIPRDFPARLPGGQSATCGAAHRQPGALHRGLSRAISSPWSASPWCRPTPGSRRRSSPTAPPGSQGQRQVSLPRWIEDKRPEKDPARGRQGHLGFSCLRTRRTTWDCTFPQGRGQGAADESIGLYSAQQHGTSQSSFRPPDQPSVNNCSSLKSRRPEFRHVLFVVPPGHQSAAAA